MTVRVFYDPHRVEELRAKGIAPQRQLRQLPGGNSDQATAQTSLELVEANARLRAENRRLSEEVARLTAEVRRLSNAEPKRREERELDDSAKRFSLLELE